MKFRKTVQIIAKGYNNCGNTQKDFYKPYRNVKKQNFLCSRNWILQKLERDGNWWDDFILNFCLGVSPEHAIEIPGKSLMKWNVDESQTWQI